MADAGMFASDVSMESGRSAACSRTGDCEHRDQRRP